MNQPTRRTRSAFRPAWCAAALLLAISGGVATAQPTTRPSGGGGGGGGPASAMQPHRPDRPGMAGRRWDRISPDEVNDAIDFARKNMPNLAKAIAEAEQGAPPQGSQPRQRLMRFAVERWRALQRIQREDPDEYDAAVERLRSHDEVFDLVRRLENAPEDQRAELRAQVREKMRAIMQDLLAEREQRIENLRRMLSNEEELLNRDRERIDELTERRAEALQREFREMRGTTSAGDLTPPDLSTAPGAPVDPNLGAAAPSTAPSRRDR